MRNRTVRRNRHNHRPLSLPDVLAAEGKLRLRTSQGPKGLWLGIYSESLTHPSILKIHSFSPSPLPPQPPTLSARMAANQAPPPPPYSLDKQPVKLKSHHIPSLLNTPCGSLCPQIKAQVLPMAPKAHQDLWPCQLLRHHPEDPCQPPPPLQTCQACSHPRASAPAVLGLMWPHSPSPREHVAQLSSPSSPCSNSKVSAGPPVAALSEMATSSTPSPPSLNSPHPHALFFPPECLSSPDIQLGLLVEQIPFHRT